LVLRSFSFARVLITDYRLLTFTAHRGWGSLPDSPNETSTISYAAGGRDLDMKTNQLPDNKIHVRKKVAGGATGAVLGAMVGGPVGALVGGVLGTAVGNAAETGKLREFTTKKAPRTARRIKGRARTLSTKVKRSSRTAATKTKRAARRVKRSTRSLAKTGRRAMKPARR
jgi:hypothetical protein